MIELVLVTRLFAPDLCSVVSVVVMNRPGALMSVEPGYPRPPCQSPPGRVRVVPGLE